MKSANTRIVLKPTAQMFNLIALLLLLFCWDTSCFTFSSVGVSMDSNQIGTQTTYYFYLDRHYDDSLTTTPWETTPLSPLSTTTVQFPAEYTTELIAEAVCLDVSVNDASITGYSCAINGNILVISNPFASISLVSSMYITVSGITNPGSTITTSSFTAMIGSDLSGNSASARVTFTPGQLASLNINFGAGIVNQTNDMLITFVTAHGVPENGAIQVTFPNTLTWARDLSTSHTIPINGTLSCYGETNNINNGTISCQGLFATQTITISSPFGQPISSGQTVTLGIKGLFAPPTTQPIDKLKVTTCDSSLNSIDITSSSISGLMPQTLLNFAITPTISPFPVNNLGGGLSFKFSLPDTISSNDYFVIAFPSTTSINYTTRTGSISIQSAAYNSTNTSLVLFQSSTNPNYAAGTSITLTFIKYRAPPSTRPTTPITLTIFSFGYSKMTASSTVTAVANNYSLSVTSASNTVNTFTSYSFSFAMIDTLASDGYISLILDPNLCKTTAQIATIQSNLSVSITGTSIKGTPSTQVVSATVNGSSTYSLVFTSLNTSTSNIPTQAITIKVSNLLNYQSVFSMSYFTLSTYYTSSNLDLVANANYSGTITLQTGNISLVSISSTATTTYTSGTLTIQLNNQNPIPSNGYLMVVFPAELNVLTGYQTSINISSMLVSAVPTNYVSNNSIILKLASQINSNTNLKIVVANSITQNTTKTTSTFIIKSYDQSFSAIDASNNSLGLVLQSGNSFNSFALTRSNSTNLAEANYTISFQQIQSSSSITVVGISLNKALLNTSLSRVYQQIYNSSNNSYQLVNLFIKEKATYLGVTLNQTSPSHTIVLSTITNSPSQQPTSNPLLVSTLTNDYQYVYSQMYAQEITNDAPSTDIVTGFSFSNFAYQENNTLSLSLKQPNGWPNLIYSLIIHIPATFGSSNISCAGFTGIVCSLSAANKDLTITASNASYLPSTLSISISNLVNPVAGTPPQTFIISSFDSANYIAQYDSSTVVFSNACTMPCRTCDSINSSNCLSCYSSSQSNYSLLYQNQCMSKCPDGSYELSSSACAACQDYCGSCAFLSYNCTACNSSGLYPFFFIDSTVSPAQGNCLTQCPSQTYLLNNTCYSCKSSCTACLNATYCTICKNSYYLYKGNCISACPNTTITKTITCQDCSINCSTCLDSVDFCTSCPNFTFLSNGSCLSSCPSPNMYVDSAQACQLCNSQCATCRISSTNCTSCNLSSSKPNLFNSTCLSSCPELYYSNVSTLVCSVCSSLGINCSNCSSSTTCLTCDLNYLFLIINSTCTNQIPVGFVAINGSIYPCNSTCLTCLGSQDNCTSCSGTLHLFNNECISTCPQAITITVGNLCQYCTFPCSTCSLIITNCTSCNPSSLLYYSQVGHNCMNGSSCPNGTFANISSFVCENCSSRCSLCSVSSTNCSTCKTGYFHYSSNNSCLSACPNGTVGIGGICKSCNSPCLTCNLTQSSCTSCIVSTPKLYLDGNLSICVVDSSCPPGTYPNGTTLICEICLSPCSECTSLNVCRNCEANYSLVYTNGSCLQSCPQGFITLVDGSNKLCQPCLSPCASCQISLNSCTSCISNSSLFLQGKACVNASQCANLTYPNSTTNQCTPCQAPCLSCSSSTNCTSCINSTFFYNSSCYNSSSCPAGTFAGVNSSTGVNQCVSCAYPCLTCSLAASNCTSCNSSTTAYYLNGNNCGNASSCPNLTYPNSTNSKCQSCQTPCLNCTNSTRCTSCIINYFLSLNSTCLSECPVGQYGVNVSNVAVCQLCSSSCAGCKESALKCVSCNNGSFLTDNSCVNASSCTKGTYANISSNICENCISPCSSCSNSTFCQSCSLLYLISSTGQCVNSTGCPINTVAYNNSAGQLQCSPCDISCFGCTSSPKYCSSCSNSSTFLQNGSCVNSSGCLAGSYPNQTLGSCSKCQPPCTQCSNSTFCQSCISGLYLVIQMGICVNSSSCPAGKTAADQNGSFLCANCNIKCQTCINSTSSCTSCPTNSSTYLQNTTCVSASECANGSYPDNLTLVCTLCPSQCALCSANNSCSKCSLNFYLIGAYCQSTCPDGTLADNASLTCKNCSSPCKTCSVSITSCTSCDQTNQTLYLLNSSCVLASGCIAGTYPNASIFICAACNQNCTTCTAYVVCTSCVSGFYLYSSMSCMSVCPDGWLGMMVSGGGVCQQCFPPCSTCLNSLSECTSCLQNLTVPLFLSVSSCVTAELCINGTFANTLNFKCSTCSPECSTCVNSSTYCSSCTPNYYMLNNSCLSSCPNTTIADSLSQSCKSCLNPCKTCLVSLTTCSSCVNGTFLSNNSCLSSCPNGTAAIVSSWSCQSCQQGCLFCSNSISNCSSCVSNYFYFNFSCSQTCPQRYYPNNSNNQCSPCTNNCSTCSNATACLSCASPLLLYSSQCLSSCPLALPYNVSNICMNCTSAIPGCLSCNSSSLSASCQQCSSNLLFLNGSCYSSCPSGFQADGKGSCKQTLSSLNSTLTNSLTTAGLFPLPFTITGSIIFVACFMSKLQNRNTYIIGVAYALYGFIETACLAYVILTFTPDNEQSDYRIYLLVALFVIGGLNLFGFVVQSWQLGHDQKFSKWLKSKCNFVFYSLIVLISALGNYKFKLILFTKLFNFQCVRAQLEHVQKFRVFNLMSFLGVGHEGLILYISALILIRLSPNTPQFLQFFDLVAVNILNVILALAASAKSDSFFQQQEQDGIRVNKVFNIHEQYQINPVDDTLDQVKKQKGLDSRQIMMDDDDQFTLSISDRQDSSVKPQAPEPQTADKLAGVKQNKNSLEKNYLRSQEHNNSLPLNSTFSGVYQGELQRERKEKSQVLLQKTPKQQNERSKGQWQVAEENPTSMKNIFEADDDVELPQQNNLVPELGDANVEIEEAKNNIMEQVANQNQTQVTQIIKASDIINVQEIKNRQSSLENQQQQPKKQHPRQIKVYKGKGELISSLPEDIEQIDLTISKKQKELIELRKSIRRRQRSQEKRSQRSKDKLSKGPQSEKGADLFTNNFTQRMTSQQMLNPKPKMQRIPLNINMVSQNVDSGIIEQIFEATPGSIKRKKRDRKPVNSNNSEIEDKINQKDIIRTPIVRQQKIIQTIIESQLKQQTPQSNQIHYIQEQKIQIQAKTPEKITKQLKYRIEEMNEMYIQSKQIPQNQHLVENIFSYKQSVEQEPLPLHKNVFEDPKDSSFFSQEPVNKNNNFLGMKAPQRKQKQLANQRDNNQPLPHPQLKIDINICADQQNTPLKSRKNNLKGGLEGQVPGKEVADFVEQTKRAKISQNRSHLLKEQPNKRNSAQYQQLQETSTVREPSFKEYTARNNVAQRPPMQNRPSTSVKNRQIAGFQHQATNRDENLSKQSSNWQLPLHTLKQGQFKQLKSKEMKRSRGEKIEPYPSSFSSNEMRLGTGELNDEPQKPTIYQAAKTKNRENSYKKYIQQQEISVQNRSSRKSMKSYRSRSIDKQQAQRQFGKGQYMENDDLRQYYNRKERQKSKSRSKSREGNRSSDKRLRQLEKIYLQRLQFKQ